MRNTSVVSSVVAIESPVTPDATQAPLPEESARRGRPRKYETEEAREKGYRKRHKKYHDKQKALKPPDPTCTDPDVWDAFLNKSGLSMDAGACLTDDSEGVALITGGHDEKELARLDHDAQQDGRRKSPRGFNERGEELR